MKSAIQLYTLRALDEPLGETLERVAATNYSGVEFAGLGDAAPETVAAKLDELDLEAVGAHVGADAIEADYEGVVDTYDTLGVERLVVPTYDVTAFRTAEGVDAAADRLSNLAGRLADDGLELLYHNHTFEFEVLADGTTAMDRFVERTSEDLRLEVDTGLAAHAGVDPVDFLERHAERTSLLHLTDTRSGSEDTLHVDLGEGEVNLEACLDAAQRIGLEWAVFENGKTDDALASLSGSDEVLAGMGGH